MLKKEKKKTHGIKEPGPVKVNPALQPLDKAKPSEASTMEAILYHSGWENTSGIPARWNLTICMVRDYVF